MSYPILWTRLFKNLKTKLFVRIVLVFLRLHMDKKSNNLKLILGLKVKHLRTKKGYSFSELSKITGLSGSYLNEIEKGKKYPKEDKLKPLSVGLGVSFEELTSTELTGSMAPLAALLKSNFLNELPLDLFGIELNKVVEIISNSPQKVGAFISALVELSRSYQMQETNFYFWALRAYQEMNLNYFPDLESAAQSFITEFKLPIGSPISFEFLSHILQKKFNFRIDTTTLRDKTELKEVRSIVNTNKKTIYLNPRLNEKQKTYQLGKELGFLYLNLTKRQYSSTMLKVNSFEQVLNNFKATYFSVCILINKQTLLKDLTQWFKQKNLNPVFLLNLSKKYSASSSVLFQRFNVLPHYFGIEKIFFLQTKHHLHNNSFELEKELHLSKKHVPHSNLIREHYCRRWLALSSLQKLQQNPNLPEIYQLQRSKYIGTDDEYLVLTNARKFYPLPESNLSVSIGMLLDDKARDTIQFLDDPNIIRKSVNITCERCHLKDCKERAKPPLIIEKFAQRQKLEMSINELL